MIRCKVAKTSLTSKLAENNHSTALDEKKLPGDSTSSKLWQLLSLQQQKEGWGRHRSASEQGHTSQETNSEPSKSQVPRILSYIQIEHTIIQLLAYTEELRGNGGMSLVVQWLQLQCRECGFNPCLGT